MQSMHYTLRSYCLKQYLMELSFGIIIQYIYIRRIQNLIHYKDLTKGLFIIDIYTFQILCRISNIRMIRIFLSLYDHGYLDLCTCHFSLCHCENVQFSNKSHGTQNNPINTFAKNYGFHIFIFNVKLLCSQCRCIVYFLVMYTTM